MSKIKGVYKIENKLTKYVYIGSSTDFEKRRKQHLTMLENNTHFNHKLQKAYNDNKDSIEIILIEERGDLNKQQLYDLEQAYINYNKYKYNLSKYTSFKNSEGRTSNQLRRKRNVYWKSKHRKTKNSYFG